MSEKVNSLQEIDLKSPHVSEQPIVSVVIPMFNEKDNILSCLESLKNQDYPYEKIEACVVDGASTDESPNLIREYSKTNSNVKLLSNPDRITPKGLNIGVKAATGEIIIILGAHTKVKKDFISKNIEYIKKQSVLCVGGTQINKGDTYIQQAIGHAMGSPFGIMSAPYRFQKNPGFVDTVVYAAYHRSLFDELGYFDEEKIISEDAEFNWRIRKAGHKIYYSPDIVSYYYPRKNLGRLARQFFQYGIFRINVVKKHWDALKILHLIPAMFVFLLGFTGVFSFFNPWFRGLFFILLLMYGIYLFIASISSIMKSNLKYLPALPIAFITMQLSFGAGFLVGLFKTYR
jgi:GT2 family glycosyltransferase